MAIITLNGGTIKTGRTEIKFPHKDKTITFIYPPKGPGNYEYLMNQIDQEELLRPTTAEILSLIDIVLQNPDEKHCGDILYKLRGCHLWTSTENLYTKEGIFVYDNIDGKIFDNEEELFKKLGKDNTIRFVSYGFKTGTQSVSDFVRNPYILAQIGEGLQEVVERVTSKLKEMSYLDIGHISGVEKAERFTVIDANWLSHGLFISGRFNGNDRGFSFGVNKTGKASAQK